MSTRLKLSVVCVAAGLALMTFSARAGSATYDFTTDQTTLLDIRGADSGPVPMVLPRWANDGTGNPGGYLVLTYAQNYFNTHVLFPDLDPGKVVTAFHFECDLKVGNSQGDRGADGFSINFARSYDPVIEHWNDETAGRGYRGDTISGECPGCESIALPETGTRTGIAISFDTWAGNTLNDGADLEGIIIAVDGVTVLNGTARGWALPTRHGACDDNTSLQTGPRDPAFWTGDFVNDPQTVYATNAWDTLCWQHFVVDLDELGRLTVIWKGRTLLDKYQTTYFPTPGRLLFGGRTGGSNEATFVDNIVLTTTAVVGELEAPTDPSNLRTTLVGARRVELAWDPSVERPDPAGRVAYNVYRDGTNLTDAIARNITATSYADAPGPDQAAAAQLVPGSAHTYYVRAVDVNQNLSGVATLPVTLAAEVAVPGYFTGKVYISDPADTTTVVDAINWTGWPYSDTTFPNSPAKQAWWLTGLSFNQPSGGFGDNYGFRFAGTVTAPKTGQYRFFLRSDDGSALWFNTAGAAIPDYSGAYSIAVETDCCDAFLEPGVGNDSPNELTYATSDPIALTAGQKYGFVWLVKEGGGGDWGQVAWRMEGDTTLAANLPAIGGAFVEPEAGSAVVSDPGGASVTITGSPADQGAGANAHLTLTVAATTVSPWGYPAHYQWFKDGSPIMNANAASYYIDVVAPADAGTYKARVSVPGAFAETAEMSLTVTNDATLPTIGVADVHGSVDLTHVTVRFSEPVTSPTATTFGNYTIAGLAVSAATRVDTYTISLTTAAQTSNTKYTLTVNNVADNAGNVIAPNTQVDWMSWVMVGTAGPVTAEIYNGLGADGTGGLITGTTVAELLAYTGYPASPDVTTNITQWNTRLFYPDDTHETYGARLSGLITPTVSGDYRFFIYSDDSSELWLSTDNTEANLVRIAQETGCCEVFQEPGSEQTSAPIPLVGGQSYFMRGIYKEGGGGDYLQVAWRKEGDRTPAASLPVIPQAYDPWVGVPIITTQPMGAAVAKGGTATFTVVAGLGARGLTYQWQRLDPRTTWVNVAGATSDTLTVTDVDVPKIGAYRVVVSNAAGSANSRGVVLTLANSFVIEAEDFDYTNGLHQAVADTMPYTGFAYDGLSATYNVDYHNDNNDSITYRRGGDLAVAGHGASMDNVTGNLLSVQRGAWDMVNNYKIGWIGTGDWHNYTRAVPNGTYTAFAALSYGDTAANALKAKLSQVTAGVGTTNQTLADLGSFLQDGSGGWGQNNLVPMKDTGGAMATFTVASQPITLRMSHDSGDFDWFMLVPTEAVVQPPEITGITVGAGGAITVTWTGGGTLQAATSITGPWQDVTSTSPYTFTPTEPMLFGRIFRP